MATTYLTTDEIISLEATFMHVLGTTWHGFAESRTDQTPLPGCKRSPPTYKVHIFCIELF